MRNTHRDRSGRIRRKERRGWRSFSNMIRHRGLFVIDSPPIVLSGLTFQGVPLYMVGSPSRHPLIERPLVESYIRNGDMFNSPSAPPSHSH